MASGKRGGTAGAAKGQAGRRATGQSFTQQPSEGALAAERASAGIGTDDASLWENWFLPAGSEPSGGDENSLLG